MKSLALLLAFALVPLAVSCSALGLKGAEAPARTTGDDLSWSSRASAYETQHGQNSSRAEPGNRGQSGSTYQYAD